MQIFGRNVPQPRSTATTQPSPDRSEGEQYELLLNSAPPEVIDEIHQEAFEKLTSDQRVHVFDTMVERAADTSERPVDDTPIALAKAATTISLRGQGRLERAFADRNANIVPGSALFAVFVGYAIGCELSLIYLTTTGLEAESLDDTPEFLATGFDGTDGGIF